MVIFLLIQFNAKAAITPAKEKEHSLSNCSILKFKFCVSLKVQLSANNRFNELNSLGVSREFFCRLRSCVHGTKTLASLLHRVGMSPKKAVVDFEDGAEHWFIFSLFLFFLGRLTSRLRLTLTQLSVRLTLTKEKSREKETRELTSTK